MHRVRIGVMVKVIVRVRMRVKVKVKVRVRVRVRVEDRVAFSSPYSGKGSPGKGYSDPLLDLGTSW